MMNGFEFFFKSLNLQKHAVEMKNKAGEIFSLVSLQENNKEEIKFNNSKTDIKD
jgi:hypothetical protein